jgi:hypothetical protein
MESNLGSCAFTMGWQLGLSSIGVLALRGKALASKR